jgi:glyoxylase-like metal-dependent hydrolase (beta-lactamase superfamily II)
MEEIAPGIYHWQATHPRTGGQAHSHFHVPSRTLLDPMVPTEEGLDWFAGGRQPERIVLTNRHHYRQSVDFVERFECPVLCNAMGLHEFEGTDREVEGIEPPAELTAGVTALQVGAICPDESAVHIESAEPAMAFADGVIRRDSGLDFVSDGLLGDDPEGIKEGLRAAYRDLLDRDFDILLFAHGEPLVGGGRDALRAFVEG